MRMNIKLIIGIFALAILLIPLAFASENVNTMAKDNSLSKSYHFSSNNSAVLAQVWGKNMTTAEFMEKVYPGSLKVLPNDIVKLIQKEPMVWPDTKKIQVGKKMVNVTKNSASNTLGGVVTPYDLIGAGVYSVEDDSFISPNAQGQVAFGSTSQVIYPSRSTTVPYISISSYLHKDGGTSPVASTSTWGANTKYEIADSYYYLNSGTHNYYTSGVHTVVWPINCNPWETVDNTVSAILYVSR
jgi:hypothetical protein